MLIGAYYLGTTQAKTETVETVPQGYISLDKCIPLDDVAYYYINSYGYPCFELKDTRYQLNNSSNMSYDDILNDLPLDTEYQNDWYRYETSNRLYSNKEQLTIIYCGR